MVKASGRVPGPVGAVSANSLGVDGIPGPRSDGEGPTSVLIAVGVSLIRSTGTPLCKYDGAPSVGR